MEMIILVGIAGSGKTTWCTKYLPSHTRISLDDIKNHDRKLEDRKIISELETGNNIVIDDTNLTKAIRKRHITIATRYHASINAVYFCIDTQKAYAQNCKRERKLPYYVLDKQKKQIEMPHIDEGFKFIQVLNV